jgi:tape measure domain-containing protein
VTYIVGELAARIRLDGKQAFDRDLSSSGQAFGMLRNVAQGAGDAIAGSLKAASVGFVGLLGGAAALGVSVFKTGLDFNQLGQTSRAALTSILGSAQAANAQMDKLDQFAKSSPFSKSVFITAQQQLLGFGLAADKVLPTLQAIQDAVAAMGGSNEQVSQITYALAQVQGQGKLTGETLNQLGQYGINAAEIIGASMGKTSGEIREMASKPGGIPAAEVWDPLVNGLESRFAGAAANVKQTMSGAVDRIKAASRDIGATLAEPFISQQGGGLAVKWANQVADLLRALQGNATPFTQWAMTKLNPTFERFSDILTRAKQNVKGWDFSDLDGQLAKVSSYAPEIAAVTAAITALGVKNIPVLGRFLPAINPVVAALGGLVALSPELRTSGGQLLSTLAPLIPVVTQLGGVLARGLNGILPVVADGIDLVTSAARQAVALLTSIPTPVLAGVAAFVALSVATRKLNDEGGPLMSVLQGIGERMALQGRLAEMSGTQLGTFGKFAAVASTEISGLGNAMKAAFMTNPIGIVLTAAAVAVGIWASANADAQAKVEEHKQAVDGFRQTLDDTTGKLSGQSRQFVANQLATDGWVKKLQDAHLSVNGYTDSILGNGKANDVMRKNITDATMAQIAGTNAQERARQAAYMLGLSYETVVSSALGNKDAQLQVEKAYQSAGDASGFYAKFVNNANQSIKQQATDLFDLNQNMTTQQEVTREALETEVQYREALKHSAESAGELALSNGRLNDAIALARDTSKDATERLNALKTALDELKGGALTAAQAEAEMNAKTLDLTEGLAQTDDAGTKLWASMVNGAGHLDTTTRAGQSFFQSLNSQNDGMLRAMQSAYDLAAANGDVAGAQVAAKDAGDKWIATLSETLRLAGFTDEQIQGLIGTYMAVPSTVVTLISDAGSITTTQQLVLTLKDNILATPDKTVTITDGNSIAPIRSALEQLGLKVTTLPDGKVQVSAVGVEDVENKLNNLARARTVNVYVAPGGKMVPQANGGFWSQGVQAFADGGLLDRMKAAGPVRAYANGSMPSDIYAGRPGGIIRFAEEETGWEAYISGKPGKEDRNRRVLSVAAERLGMIALPKDAARAAAAEPSARDTGLTLHYTHIGQNGIDGAEALFKAARRLKIRR